MSFLQLSSPQSHLLHCLSHYILDILTTKLGKHYRYKQYQNTTAMTILILL